MLQLPPIAILAQLLNIMIAVVLWIGYKIARVKLSVDLRLWVIVEGVTFSYFIVIQTILMLPVVFTNLMHPLIFTGLFMLFVFLTEKIRPFVATRISGRWNAMKTSTEGESHLLDMSALYLVNTGPMDIMAYVGVGSSFAMFILLAYQTPVNPIAILIPISILSLVLL